MDCEPSGRLSVKRSTGEVTRLVVAALLLTSHRELGIKAPIAGVLETIRLVERMRAFPVSRDAAHDESRVPKRSRRRIALEHPAVPDKSIRRNRGISKQHRVERSRKGFICRSQIESFRRVEFGAWIDRSTEGSPYRATNEM